MPAPSLRIPMARPHMHFLYLLCETVPATADEEGQSRVLIKGVSVQLSTLSDLAFDNEKEGNVVWAAVSMHSEGEVDEVAPALIHEWETGRHGWRCTNTHATEEQVHLVRINAMAIFDELVYRFFH